VTTPVRTIRDCHATHLGPALIRQAIADGRRSGRLTFREAAQLERELFPHRRPGKTPRTRPRGALDDETLAVRKSQTAHCRTSLGRIRPRP
jgi:hypothetical protein